MGDLPANSQHIGIGFNGELNSSYATAFFQKLDCRLHNATSILLFTGDVTRPGNGSGIRCPHAGEGVPCDDP